MTIEEFDDPYVVEVQSPLLREPHLRGFDDRAAAEAFMDECRDEGCQVGAVRLTARAIGTITLHGREGITVRPEPAVMVPRARR